MSEWQRYALQSPFRYIYLLTHFSSLNGKKTNPIRPALTPGYKVIKLKSTNSYSALQYHTRTQILSHKTSFNSYSVSNIEHTTYFLSMLRSIFRVILKYKQIYCCSQTSISSKKHGCPRLFKDRSSPHKDLDEDKVFERNCFRAHTIIYIVRLLPDLFLAKIDISNCLYSCKSSCV